MFNKTIAKISNMSIMYKILLSYFLLLIITLGIVLSISSYIISDSSKEQTLFSAKQVLNQTKSNLDHRTESLKKSLIVISMSEVLQEIIMRNPNEYDNNVGLWTIDTNKIDSELFPVSSNPDINRIQIYMDNGPAKLFTNEKYLDLSNYHTSNWYKEFIESDNTVDWFSSYKFNEDESSEYISVLKKIPEPTNIRSSIGLIKIDIAKDVFKNILAKAVFTQGTHAVIINSKKELLFTSNQVSFNEDILFNAYSNIKNSISSDGYLEIQQYGNSKYLLGANNIESSDWTLMLFTPYKEIEQIAKKSNKRITYVFIIIGIITLPLAFFISKSITKRIYRLINHMQSIENSDFNNILQDNSNDEIGKLTKNFNYLVYKIKLMMNEKYEMGKEIKNLELKALQAQINPHFLYNTLDQIYWMSLKLNAPKMSKIVISLSNFYKLSLRKGQNITTIKNEIEHVKNYIAIQNIRYDDFLTFKEEVQNDLLDKPIIKIILQPIIENSILHGILETEEEKGTITIKVTSNEEDISISIHDNGVGMDQTTIDNIFSDNNSKGTHGYGLKNIDQRLKLNYGPKYGLTFTSQLQKGTTVIVKIPNTP